MALVRAAATDYDAYLLDVEIYAARAACAPAARVRFSVHDPHTQATVRRFELVHERVFHPLRLSARIWILHPHPPDPAPRRLARTLTLELRGPASTS